MKSFQCFILSLLVHLLLFGGLAIIPQMPPLYSPTEVEIVYETTEPPKTKQFVTQTDSERLVDALQQLKKKANFLSEKTQRVRQQQIARKTGRTANRQKMRPSQNTADQRPPLTGPGPRALAKEELYKKNARMQDSTISEHIPEVKVGGFTSLNTDQFLYYTFYSRINEQLRNRWIRNLRQLIDSYPPAYLQRLSYKAQLTEVEILLDPSGKYVRSIIHKKSEDQLLDRAATEAFVLAQPFNNPPEEIIADDGYIHLHYGFYVQLKPRYLANGKK